jgi:hypothetical protein
VKNLAHSASFHSREKFAPSNPGTKQLAKAYDEDDITVTRYQVETALQLPHSEAWWAQKIIENRKRSRGSDAKAQS